MGGKGTVWRMVRPVSQRGIGINRRDFLKLAGATTVSSAGQVNAASEVNPELYFDSNAGLVRISYLGLEHSIIASDFGPDAMLSGPATNGEITKDWRAEVAARPLPGTSLSLKGTIKLVRTQGLWLICFRFDQLYLRQDVLLSDWLHAANGNAALDFLPHGTLTGNQAATLSKRFPHAGLRLPKGATIVFQPAGLFAADFAASGYTTYNVFAFNAADTGILLGHSALRVTAAEAVLAWTSDDSVDRIPGGPYTWILPVSELACSVAGPLGKTHVAGQSVQAWIADCSIQDGHLRFAKAADGSQALDARFMIGGRLRFEHSLPHTWAELPFGQTIFHWARSSAKTDKVRLTGTAPERGSLTRGGDITASVLPGEIEDFLIVQGGQIIDVNWRATLASAFIPMENADYSRFNFAGTRICAVIEGLGTAIHTTDFIWSLGEVPQLSGVLSERATLYFHRTADLADLRVHFRNLTLLARPDGAVIDSLEEPVPGGTLGEEDVPLLIFELPPQQIAERTYLLGKDHADKGLLLSETQRAVPLSGQRAYQLPNSISNGDGTFKLAVENPEQHLTQNLEKAREDREPELGEIGVIVQMLDHLVEARASGPTRIVLEIPQVANDSGTPKLPLHFSSDVLLCWEGFRTRVSRRALPRNATIEDQLEVAGILRNTPTNRKIEVIGNELDGLTQGRIGPLETKIEYPYDLHLSPSAEALWLTSPSPTDARRARGMGLFWAQIDPAHGADTVRALWSRSFEANIDALFGKDRPEDRSLPRHSTCDPALLIPGLGKPSQGERLLFGWRPSNKSKADGFRLPMDIRDRFELVMLTSIYGLPSLLPEPTVIGEDGLPKKEDVLPTKLGVTKNPAADPFVAPVPGGWVKSSGSLGDEGVFVPRPFRQFEFRFTSLGATGYLTGEWEPPSGYLDLKGGAKAPEYPGLTIERVRDRAFQGRHVEVEVVYKGFLFPFGHRCSIVKATERSFTDDPDHFGRSVAPLVQRFFIVVGKPEKTVPALGMPFDGRAFPGTSIRLLTTRTKEIEDPWGTVSRDRKIVLPFDPKIEPEIGKQLEGASAFHPYGLGEGVPLPFSFVIGYDDGTASDKMTAPLIVVDNTFAHYPQLVSRLVAEYNGDGNTTIFREAALGMQRVKYAAERVSGDTEFRTQSWRLGAHPREVTDPDLQVLPIAPYTMDAVMEGADQPPFYPCVASAQVEVQSINALNGKSGGLVEVAHDAHYLTHGFAKGINDAEIYLALIDSNFIDTTHRKNASGGLATPNSKIVALSRLKGPVGGTADRLKNTKNTLPTGVRTNGSLSIARVASLSSGQLPASHQNKFDPLEYFGAALSGAKLFGAIPLKDVVRAIGFVDGAPELLETVTSSFFDFQEDSKAVALDVIAAFTDLLADARNQADVALDTLELNADDLYPALFAAMRDLGNDLGELRDAIATFVPAPQPDTGAVVAATAKVATGLKTLHEHVKRVIANPTPAIVDDFIKAAQTAFTELKDVGKNLVRAVKNQLNAEVEALLTVEICVRQGETSINWTQEQKDTFVLLSPILGLLPQDVHEAIRLNRSDELPAFCQKFSLAEPDGLADAGNAFDTLRRRAQEALFYETVGKPLVDGYIALETFRKKYSEEDLSLDAAIKSFPQELLTVAETWLDGALRLNQMAALINDKIDAVGDLTAQNAWEKLVKPALCEVILPLVDPVLRSGAKLGVLSINADNSIEKLVTRVRGLIQKAPTPDLRGQLQQVLSGLAQAQKQLRGATADLNGTIEAIAVPPGAEKPKGVCYIDLNFDYEQKKDDYLRPLKQRFDQSAKIGPSAALLEINGQIGRLILRKEQVFRAAKDVIRQGADAVQLADVLATIEESHVAASSKITNFAPRVRSVLKEDVESILEEAKSLLAAVAEIVKLMLSNASLNDPAKTDVMNVSLDGAKKRFASTAKHVDNIHDTYRGHGKALKDAIGGVESAKSETEFREKVNALAGALDGIIAYTFGDERMIAGLAGQAFALFDDGKGRIKTLENQAIARIGEKLLPAAKIALRILVELNRLAHGALEALQPDTEYAPLLKLFLSPFVYDALFGAKGLGALNDEHQFLATIHAELEKLPSTLNAKDLRTAQIEIEKLYILLRAWIEGIEPPSPPSTGNLGPGPAVIAAFVPMAAVFDTVTKGRIGELIDFRGLERALRETLMQFIPSEFYTDLGWATTIDPFPSEAGKFFWIERKLRDLSKMEEKLGTLTAGYLKSRKQKKLKPANPDFVIASRAGVRLTPDLEPKPFFRVESHIFDPSIKLFGDSFHVVTIQMEYIRFIADEKGSDLDVRIRPGLAGESAGIIFGPIVGYIASLAEAFGDLMPPWLKLRPDLPGVSAEFGFPAFSISIGTMSILNLSVNIEIEVPFSNLPITSRFRLADRDRPFLISFAPYGGGGYVGLITRATDIVGFELQLEFGAVVGLAFPPFNGYGAVMAGIYIEQQQGRDLIIAGFVRAIGEGTLGIFSIAVHIEVRVTGQGEDVKGSATFSFTFKVKIVSITISFEASYAFAGGKRGNGERSRFPLGDIGRCISSSGGGHKIVVKVPEPQEAGQWIAYRSLFME